jgi:hypothetical protein
MSPRGLLFSQMDPPPGEEDDFHDWYEHEHIPARIALDGFTRAARYRGVDGGPAHLAVYELKGLDVLATPEYVQLKEQPSERTARMLGTVASFTRYTCRELSDTGDADETPFLFAVAFAVPDAELDQFEDFYETEHVPLLMRAPSWSRVRRYAVEGGEGGPWNRLALHELRSRDALDSPEHEAARTAPKRAALADRDWFASNGRWVYELIGSHR